MPKATKSLARAGPLAKRRSTAPARAAEVARRARSGAFVRHALWKSDAIGIIASDFDGTVVNANEAFLRMTGMSRRELRRGEVRWWDMTPAPYLALDERGKKDLLGRRRCVPFEKEYVRKDGTRIPVLLGAALLEPSRQHCVAFIVDLTERKQSEEARRRAQEQAKTEAVLRERNRLAREIHDTIAQGLAGIVIQLEVAEQALGAKAQTARGHIRAAKDLARSSLAEARRSVLALRGGIAHPGDLRAALAHHLERIGTEPTVRLDWRLARRPLRLAPGVEVEIVRIVQEAVANAVAHAAASRIAVRVGERGGHLHVTVEDDGRGFDPSVRRDDRFGLVGLAERAERISGELRVTSAPGSGTKLALRVPLGRRADGTA
jgi:PAS domain S-box-containing protein